MEFANLIVFFQGLNITCPNPCQPRFWHIRLVETRRDAHCRAEIHSAERY